MPYMGEGNTYRFCPQIVASFLWAGDHLHPSDANTSSCSADYLFFFQIFISRLLCCPAHSSSSSFAWHKHVIFFFVNVLNYGLVLVPKHYFGLKELWFVLSNWLFCTAYLLPAVCSLDHNRKVIWATPLVFKANKLMA